MSFVWQSRNAVRRWARRAMQKWFEDLKAGIAVGKPTIDMMVFDTTAREAHVSRGPSYGVNWQSFGFS